MRKTDFFIDSTLSLMIYFLQGYLKMMKEFFSTNSGGENFTPCNYRLVDVGFDVNNSTFDTIIKKVRLDYCLFCVESGRIVVQTKNSEHIVVEKGEFYLYFPNTSEHFLCEGSVKVKRTWVHFMGTECDELIKFLQIKEGKITVKQTSNAQEILKKLLDESVSKPIGYEVMCKSLLLSLLTTLARDKINLDSSVNEETHGTMMNILDLINKNPRISNKELASSLNTSVDHFVRIFKCFFKVTPHQYKLKIIMESAKNYLVSSNITVNQIAELLGYNSDGLYFNASFKKFTGVSPTEYRAQNKVFKPKENSKTD